jgi:hypothetical protein
MLTLWQYRDPAGRSFDSHRSFLSEHDLPLMPEKPASAMPKSAEEYREEARRVRALAMGTTSPIVQAALLNVAAHYDELAHQAETLAALDSPEFSRRER